MICRTARESMKLQYRNQSSHRIAEKKMLNFVFMLVEHMWLLSGSIWCHDEMACKNSRSDR